MQCHNISPDNEQIKNDELAIEYAITDIALLSSPVAKTTSTNVPGAVPDL